MKPPSNLDGASLQQLSSSKNCQKTPKSKSSKLKNVAFFPSMWKSMSCLTGSRSFLLAGGGTQCRWIHLWRQRTQPCLSWSLFVSVASGKEIMQCDRVSCVLYVGLLKLSHGRLISLPCAAGPDCELSREALASVLDRGKQAPLPGSCLGVLQLSVPWLDLWLSFCFIGQSVRIGLNMTKHWVGLADDEGPVRMMQTQNCFLRYVKTVKTLRVDFSPVPRKMTPEFWTALPQKIKALRETRHKFARSPAVSHLHHEILLIHVAMMDV